MEDKSNWYIAILLGSLTLLATSGYASTAVNNHLTVFLIHVITSVVLCFVSLVSLSFAAAEHWRLKKRRRIYRGKLRPFQFFPYSAAVFVTRATGLLSSGYLFALPLLCPSEDHFLLTSIRIPTSFFAFKLLDLTVARARKPPILRQGQHTALYGLTDWEAHGGYVWRALTETRYKSFDIAVDESRRQSLPVSRAWTFGPLLIVPLTLLFPKVVELIVLGGLLGLQLGLEAPHTLLHSRCPNWLFWQPFAASSITEFWALRWHKGVNTFLHSLGYVPAKLVVGKFFGKDAGKAAGVLSAFSLSGIWHAWCGWPLTRDEHVWAVSVGMWVIFVLQGVGILVESWLFKDERWKRGRRHKIARVLGWVYSVETASIWLRYALPRGKLV